MRVLIAVVFASGLISANAIAAPGYLWEIGMEIEGMPFAMPKQKICSPKDSQEPPVSGEQDECKILEKKQTGKRYQWKAQCKEGMMVGDITSTPTSYSGKMKMTDLSGDTVSMKLSGKRLGACEYKDITTPALALQKQTTDLLCQNALAEMQGQLMVDLCPKEMKIFCQRIATPDGYYQATRHLPADMINHPDSGAPALARQCKLDHPKLLTKLCATAVSSENFNFVSRICPAEQPKLCAKAMNATRFDYLDAHCPTEKESLIKAHCEGRKFTSDIEPRFAEFCANAAYGMNASPTTEAPIEDTTGSQMDAVEAVTKEKIQQGIKQLRGLFGF